MNLSAIRRQIARIQTRLDAKGDDRNFFIPAHSGMAGLRTAIQQAEAARGEAAWVPPVGGAAQGAIARLREAILKDQARRTEIGPALYADTEAIYDIEEADK